jgi:hypothetical protein
MLAMDVLLGDVMNRVMLPLMDVYSMSQTVVLHATAIMVAL